MKFSIICIFLVFLVLISGSVYAGLAVSVSGGDWVVGDIGMGVTKSTSGSRYTVANEGNETVSIYIKADGLNTHPSLSAGEDTFVLKHNALIDWSSQITNTDNGLFLTSLSESGSKSFDLQFTSPNSMTVGSSDNISVILTATAFEEGDDVRGPDKIIDHYQGDVCPETVTITYKTVIVDLTGQTKIWLAQNLGSTQQATLVTDSSNASAGWYWQFNRKQGYKIGPSPEWMITSIEEDSNWLAENDPCTLLLGTGWRIPTQNEWAAVDTNDLWYNYNNAFESPLKLHGAGNLSSSFGSLRYRGERGYYWSGNQWDISCGVILYMDESSCITCGSSVEKAFGYTVRCLKD